MTASPDTTPDRTTLTAFATLVVIGGINVIMVKESVAELAPLWAAAARFLAAGAVMAAIVVGTRRHFPRGRSLSGAALYGAVGFAGAFGLVSPALRDVPAPTAAVFIALVPLFTFGLAIAQGQERFHVQGLLGALIALGGVGVIFADQLSANVPIGSLLLIVGGALCIAESGVIVKSIPRADPFGTNAVAMLTGGAILLVGTLAAGEPFAVPTEQRTWIAMGYLVVIGSVVMFSLYVFTLERWTASAVSYLTLLMPLVTTIAAASLFGARPTPTFLLGGGIILLGVYVGAFLRIRPRRSSATSAPECLPIDACGPATSTPSVSAVESSAS